MSTIFFFVKFFNKQQYAEEFLAGKVFASRLSVYKGLESEQESGRYDPDEGTTFLLQPGRVEVKLSAQIESGGLESQHNPVDVMDLSADLAGPVQGQMDWLNRLNVFCIYAVHTGELDMIEDSEAGIEVLREQFRVDDRMNSFGEHAVVIFDPEAFVKRLDQAVCRESYAMRRGLVRYYDPDSFHGHLDGYEAALWKQEGFRYQSEYRFAIDTAKPGVSALTLHVGDLSEMAFPIGSRELNGPKFLGGKLGIVPKRT